ncbi:MAG: hypothetical protein ACO4CH_06345, partial [Saprospiraceae bacterium]
MNRNAVSGWFPAPRQSCLRLPTSLPHSFRKLPLIMAVILSLWASADTTAQTVACKDSAEVAYSIISGSGSVTVPANALIESYSGVDSFAIGFVSGTLTGHVVVPCDSLDGNQFGIFEVQLVAYNGGSAADSCTTYLKILDESPALFKSLPGDISRVADAGECYASGISLSVPIVTDGCFGDTTMTFFERSDGLGEMDSFLVGSTAVTFIYDDPHTEDTLVYTYNVIVTGDAPVVTDFLQPAIRDCDMNDTIDMDDLLVFGCTESDQSMTITAPFALACDGDTLWGILPGVLPSGVVYAANGGNSASPPTVTLSGSFNGGQLTWCFQNPPVGSTLCYETLTYVWMGDSKPPMVHAPSDVTLYASDEITGGYGIGQTDDCTFDSIADIAMLAFDPVTCERSGCIASPIYPFADSSGMPAMAICDTFYSDPPGEVFGGFYTDNCAVDTVEFRRSFWSECADTLISSRPTTTPDSVSEWAGAAGNDPNVLYDFTSGYHMIEVRVKDAGMREAIDTFWITIIDDVQPEWQANLT